MELIIFIIYLFYFIYAFKLYGLGKHVDLSFVVLSSLFTFKVICGCLNLYFHNSEYLSNDAHGFYNESLVYLSDFKNQPVYYIKYWLFDWGGISEHLNFFNRNNAYYWSDVGRLMHTRFMILCNILSFGNEYVNVIFYNVVYFLGQIALLKSLIHFQPNKKWLFVIILFFLPGIAFWCSGIHKDGFVLAAFGLVSWYTIKVFRNKHWKNILFLVISLFLMLGIRYFYFLCFLPAYIGWWYFRKSNKAFIGFAIIYGVGLLSFFFLQEIAPKANLMKIVVNKQQQFLSSKGYSDLRTPELEINPGSFLCNTPIALEHIFIEPMPQLGKMIKYDVAALDSALVLIIIALSLIYFKRKRTNFSYYWLMLFFSVSILLFVGLTVPNLGALVRYKSPFIAILLCALVSFAEFPFEKKLLSSE